MRSEFTELLQQIKGLLASKEPLNDRLQQVCQLLSDEVSHYNWVGFYMVEPATPNLLILGPYLGDPTDHERIEFGIGICGTVAETKRTMVVQDISKVTNYIPCSHMVSAEIVAPILRGGADGTVLGELDIDSHTLAPYTDDDIELVEAICTLIEPLL